MIAETLKLKPGELKARREKMGLSIDQFALAAQVSGNTVRRCERENRLPSHRYASVRAAYAKMIGLA